jgi:hypothetical protein
MNKDINKNKNNLAINSIKNLIPTAVITVPHYTCIKTVYHLCDTKAYDMAKRIRDKLAEYGINTIILLGDINRSIIDLNRKESRNTEFRKVLRREVKERISQNPQRKVFLIDCHSFDRGFKTRDNPDPQFVILYDTGCEMQYIHKLYTNMKDAGIRVNLLEGLNNDIMDEFTCIHNVIPVLLEISEIHYTDDLINKISEIIKNWVIIISTE